MNMNLNKDILKNYFNYLKFDLKTGVDKVTVENFESHLDDNLDIICRKIMNNTYKFSRLKELNIGSRTVFIPTIRDRIVIEYLKDSIKKKYKLKMQNRDTIIKNIINLLSEQIEYFVIKLDINKFFSSIPQKELLDKIERKSLLNSIEYALVHNLLSKVSSGLPEGLSISNYLSELYLENFDFILRRIHPRVAFYARYVDDIIIIINGRLSDKEKDDIKLKIQKVFSSINLVKNESKCKYTDFKLDKSSDTFDYLGYKFQRICEDKKCKLNIGISDKKLTKIYKKINYIFYEYYRDKNYEKLCDRLLVLASKNKIDKIKSYTKKNFSIGFVPYKITYGLPENYKYINDDSFEKIRKFIKRKIYKLKPILKNKKMKKLYAISIIDPNRIIIYSKIPFKVLRKKVYAFSKSIPYSTILKMSKKELLETYFNIVNIKLY
ncbi:MAG TPA: hypothetical protein GX498_09035 [Clostridiales bacterium]|nr:hypothetical protein [Clostridiales bacterium]